MRLCEKCGRSFPDSKKFCSHCGERLPDPQESPQSEQSGICCPSCGKELANPEAKFCKSCGAQLDVQDQTPKEPAGEEKEEQQQPSFSFDSRRPAQTGISAKAIYASLGVVAVVLLIVLARAYLPISPPSPEEIQGSRPEASAPAVEQKAPVRQESPVRIRVSPKKPEPREASAPPPARPAPARTVQRDESQGQRGMIHGFGKIRLPSAIYLTDYSGPRLYGHSRGGFEFDTSRNKWLEYYDGKQTYTFNEMGNDNAWTYLFDSSRDMALRLPRSRGPAQWSTDGRQWNSIYEVVPNQEFSRTPNVVMPDIGDAQVESLGPDSKPSRGPMVDSTASAEADFRPMTRPDEPQEAVREAAKAREKLAPPPSFYVEHQHFPGKNCFGTLYVLEDRLRYESSTNPDCSFEYLFSDLKNVKTTGFPKGLRIEPKKGRKYQFLTSDGDRILETYRKESP